MSVWRPCSGCKKPIAHGQIHQVCSVSTCNRARVGFVFCCVACWDAHVPVMNHRDAWCEERRAPREEAAPLGGGPLGGAPLDGRPPDARAADPRRRIVPSPAPEPVTDDVLIIASRLKQYISDRADMNTAGDVLEVLSEIVRVHADAAIERARADCRKTVKGRDFR